MKKGFLIMALLASGLATMTAQTSLEKEFDSGKECPEGCFSSSMICCDTPGGSTYYGQLAN